MSRPRRPPRAPPRDSCPIEPRDLPVRVAALVRKGPGFSADEAGFVSSPIGRDSLAMPDSCPDASRVLSPPARLVSRRAVARLRMSRASCRDMTGLAGARVAPDRSLRVGQCGVDAGDGWGLRPARVPSRRGPCAVPSSLVGGPVPTRPGSRPDSWAVPSGFVWSRAPIEASVRHARSEQPFPHVQGRVKREPRAVPVLFPIRERARP